MATSGEGHIPFNRSRALGNETDYVRDAILGGHLSADGPFTQSCQQWLEQTIGCTQALLTQSCTAALEMAALLLDIRPGDEVIMPSFTFSSTANAFVLRGGVPVFVDIRPDTLNIDETRIESAITPRTRAVVAVHYAGVPCEMAPIAQLAMKYGLVVVEDAAQALMSSYGGQAAGSLGDLAATSFHETKNVTSGEGGALLLNRPDWNERALILRDKGTDRSKFLRGIVDKYSWVDIGSSYGPSELNAAFLWAQLEGATELTGDRRRIWQLYDEALADLEEQSLLRRPIVPAGIFHNAHMYYVLLSSDIDRERFLSRLAQREINAVFHYVPLHSSPAGRRFGRVDGTLLHTNHAGEHLVRLPLWSGMTESQVLRVIEAVHEVLRVKSGVSALPA